jgi:hypothetical protein
VTTRRADGLARARSGSTGRDLGWFVRRIVFAAIGAAAGCSLIVDGNVVSVHCDSEGAAGPPACPDGFTCTDGLCVATSAPMPELGQPCASDADCNGADFCFDPSAFGHDGHKRCSRPCCTSAECDPDATSVCWSPPVGGGNFCMSAAELGRGHAGKATAGAACMTSGECRSGSCVDQMCADPCCSDTDCAPAGKSCHPDAMNPATLTCASADIGLTLYARCANDAACASELCLSVGGELRCAATCCSSSECERLPSDGGFVEIACSEVEHGEGRVRACADALPMGASRAVGEPCASAAQCSGGQCVDDGDGTRSCSDACCLDADCGNPAAFVCRPAPDSVLPSASSSLRCQAK